MIIIIIMIIIGWLGARAKNHIFNCSAEIYGIKRLFLSLLVLSERVTMATRMMESIIFSRSPLPIFLFIHTQSLMCLLTGRNFNK